MLCGTQHDKEELLWELGGKLARTWLNQDRAVRENNSRYAAIPSIDTCYLLSGRIVFFDMYRFVLNATGFKPSFRHAAITTPRCNIHFYFLFVG